MVGGLQLLNVPLAWLCLKLGAPAQSIYWVAICVAFVCLCARLYMLRRMIGLPVGRFVKEVFLNELLVVVLSMCMGLFLSRLIPLETWWGFLLHAFLSLLFTALTILMQGLSSEERKQLIAKLLKR